ncbi:UxaA family hydrolase [Brevibacillus sp. B_LB10_24]|uniref:UxaA family hydrolase n=1 Tax=Brevibacillus sp. B_LB10_24 TaxID=3380645 RepID=UPI0038BCDCBC
MTTNQYHAVIMNPADNVATALADIPADATVEIETKDLRIQVKLKAAIEFGHKFAVKRIENGQNILKYGEVIGVAIADIEPGEHVHIHNLEGKRGRGDKLGQAKQH